MIRQLYKYFFGLCTSIIFAISAHCEATPTTLLIFDKGPQWHLGDGINQVTNEQHSTCLKSESETSDDRALSQVIDVNYLNTQKDLRNTLEIGAFAAAFGVGTTFSFKLDDVVSSESHEERSNLYLRVRITGKSRRFVALEPSKTALDLMSADGTGKLFAQACGDSVVNEIEDGAELFAVISYHAGSKKDEDELISALKVAAHGTGQLDADLRKKLVEFSHTLEANVHIIQTGLASVPIPSFTDLAQLIEHARTFASQIHKTDEARPLRAHLIKFANIPAFQLARVRTKVSLLQFDDSVDIMSDIIDGYELARDRQKLVASALSSPRDFEGKDISNKAVLTEYQQKVAQKVQVFSKAAHDCAKDVKGGQQCVHPVDLAVPPLPDIRPVPACTLTEADLSSDDGCKERIRLNGSCSCIRCKFLSRRLETRPVTIEKVCTGMPVGAKGLVSYSGTVGVSHGTIDGWYFITPGNRARMGDGHAPLQFDFIADDPVTVPANGEVKAKIVLDQCQSNAVNVDTCWIAPKANTHIVDVRVEVLNELISERLVSDVQ